MKGKNFIIFGLGVAGGFVGGSVFVLSKILKSERMRQASVDVLADKIGKLLFGEGHRHPRSNKYNYADQYYYTAERSYD